MLAPRRLRRLAVCAASVVAALALPASALAECPGGSGAPGAADGVAATLCLLNAERAAQGLGPLSASPALDAAARGHAGAMVAQGFFAHDAPDGGTLLDRLRASGWLPVSGAWSAGEDIAWGSGDDGTPVQIVAAWMASPGHRANILTPGFDEVGLGISPGAPQAGVPGAAATYVADFGTRSDPAPAKPKPRQRPKPKARCARASKRTPHRCR